MSAPTRTFTTELWHEGNLCAIRVPFDPKEVFGKTRAPVKVTLNGYTYRSTISVMGGVTLIPLRKSHREGAGLTGHETLAVQLTLDEEVRTVEPPPDLLKALKATPASWKRWQALSYSHQREWAESVEEAKKPETRARRVTACVAELQTQAAAGASSPARTRTRA